MRPVVIRRILCLLALIGLLCCVVAQCLARQEVDGWPRYEAYRCRRCGAPAAVNPDCRNQWACPRCGRVSYRLHRYFRLATREDFGWDGEAFERACVDGEMYPLADDYYHSLYYAWARQAPPP